MEKIIRRSEYQIHKENTRKLLSHRNTTNAKYNRTILYGQKFNTKYKENM